MKLPTSLKITRSVFEWAETFVVSLCVVIVVMTLFVRHSPVNGHSMYPTLQGTAVNAADEFAAPKGQNDILLISNLFYTPKSGDIVVTQSNFDMSEPLVKRIIATAGQTLKIDFYTWEVWVDGELLSETYVNHEEGTWMREDGFVEVMSGCERTDDGGYVIPEGMIFCMGDNRNHSSDSRYIGVGLIDQRYVVGKVIFRIYPFNRIGLVK
ncbi:MAG: signal peptidase I [Clostridiales bacterium]|nr:signal peptidase I [Clostridiales bacterium]